MRPPKEQNPFLTEKGKEDDGVGFPIGKDGGQVDNGDEAAEEVVGIEIVADEPRVSCS